MANEVLRYCATDKEIYDLLMSARQRINESALHEMARARGIFYSPNDSREALVAQISLLPHDYDAVREMMGQSENPNRAEKVTSVTLAAKLSNEVIKEVVNSFREQSHSDEKVTAHAQGTDKYVVQVEYSELDYGRTRLLQRRTREADIRFVVEGDKTTIRMPANAKAKQIVAELTAGLNTQTNKNIPAELIELTDLQPDDRTLFFTSLITSLPDYELRNVTNVRVQSGTMPVPEDDEEPEEDDETVKATEEMLSVVENVALNGQSLLASPEYQDLRKKGFYITSITWISQQTNTPYNRVEFDAGFEEPKDGKGFRYYIRGLYRRNNEGEFTKTLRPLTVEHKHELFPIIEQTAHSVLSGIRQKDGQTADQSGGEEK